MIFFSLTENLPVLDHIQDEVADNLGRLRLQVMANTSITFLSLDTLPDTSSPISSDDEYDIGDTLNDYNDVDIMGAALQTATDCLDRLFRLAIKLRSSSARINSSKAYRYQQVDDDTGVDLIQRFADMDLQHVETLLVHYRLSTPEDIKADIFLVQRLAKANTRRRQQFGYWNRHKLKQIEGYEQTKKHIEVPDRGPKAISDFSRPTTATYLDAAAAEKIDLTDSQSVVTTFVSPS